MKSELALSGLDHFPPRLKGEKGMNSPRNRAFVIDLGFSHIKLDG